MDIRSQRNNSRRASQSGAVSVQVLVILVPVVFAFMGFAVDLGRLYLIRGELKTAAESMALAAAQKLIGTEAATEAATAAARLTLDNTQGFGNKYDFGGLSIGDSNGTLASEAPDPSYFETVECALGQGDPASGGDASGATARHAGVTITAEAPLVFWGFFQQALERRTPVVARAVAGISAPLCTACGIEPVAVAALDASDETDFGFLPNTKYTLGYVCNGGPQPGGLTGATQRIPYLLVNRLNEDAEVFTEESTQLFRLGAGGLPSTTNQAFGCLRVNAEEQIWVNAAPINCNQNQVVPQVTAFACGLAMRLEPDVLPACENIAEVATLATAFRPDTDTADLDDYSGYTGSTRRVITVAVVDSLAATGSMVVLGFRQFLIEPDPNSTNLSPSDSNARIAALYIGSVVPLKQGGFAGCQLTAGPGKVVLHQ